MSPAAIETWLFVQILLEAVLVLLMIFFLMRLRTIRRESEQMPDEVQKAIADFLSESQRLSAEFTRNLEEKKELSVGLLLNLERKITEMNLLLERAEAGLSKMQGNAPQAEAEKANPAAPENRALVIRLAEQNHSIEEIARRAKLHRGEVELILDLERQFKNEAHRGNR